MGRMVTEPHIYIARDKGSRTFPIFTRFLLLLDVFGPLSDRLRVSEPIENVAIYSSRAD